MPETTQSPRCIKCGGVLSGYASEGLCAACLLESAIDGKFAAADANAMHMPLLAFADYELLEEIARGGMGVVYRARQTRLNRLVALKMILGGHLANAAEVKRFRAEAETAAQLQHPNIVAIHEVGEYAGQPFFSMALVEGQNLAQLVRNEPLPSRKAASYLKTIAEAVQYAHSRGVLHRDLKPSNILIDENDAPRVTDFGLAKRLSDSQLSTNDAQLTQTGQVLGSPSFIPPEQAAGQKEKIGPASDVYSLGAILYHCLTARAPFVADTLTQTLRLVAEQEPVSPRLLNASVPRDLETICLKCLEKEPARRYVTAQALADDLRRFLNSEPIRARPVGIVIKVHRWCLRNKALALSGTVGLALLLVVAIGSPIAVLRIDRERAEAEANQKKARTEAVRSLQVAQFLKEMLKSAGPSVALGRDVTVLREMLEKTSDRVGKELKDQPEVQGDIYSTIGNTFLDIADHRRAITNYEQAVASYRLAFPGDHPNLANALCALGFCQSFTEDLAHGTNNTRLGLEMARRCGNEQILFTCLWRRAISLGPWGMGSAESGPYLREAFELKKRMGNDPVGLANAMQLYASQITNTEEAEQLVRGGLELYRKHLPAGDPRTIQGIFNLGQYLIDCGKFEEAEPVMAEALEGFHKTHSPNHPYQHLVLRFYLETLLGQGKDEQAEAVVRERLDGSPTNSSYLDLSNRVARLRASWPSAPAIRSELRGDFLCTEPKLLDQTRSPEELEKLWRSVLKDREDTLGYGAGETVNARFSLASVLVREGKQADADALYREMAETYPDAAGHFYGRAGLWKEAAVAFARNIEAKPDDLESYRLMAPILLFNGEVEGYRAFCRQIITRSTGELDATAADRLAKACLIHPDSRIDLKVAAAWADIAVTLGHENENLPWFQLCKALAEYRQEHWVSAVEWAKKALGKPGQLERDACAYFVLAMAQAKLKQSDAARTAFSKATELVEEKLPKLDGGDLGNWVDVLHAHILMREASSLIEPSPSSAGDVPKIVQP